MKNNFKIQKCFRKKYIFEYEKNGGNRRNLIKNIMNEC